MNNQNYEISTEDLKKFFLSNSSLISEDIDEAGLILSENGYNEKKLENEGLKFIDELKSKVRDRANSNNILLWKRILSSLSSIGISKDLVENRILPSTVLKNIGNRESLELAIEYLASAFDLDKGSLKLGEKISLKLDDSFQTLYKKPVNSNISQIKAYSHYAHFIAKTVTKACKDIKVREYPLDTKEFRLLIEDQNQKIDLVGILEAVWNLGICILPLKDSGIFHGASWNINGRHVIILKQKTESHAKWIFDLLHELYHVFVHLEDFNSAIIEEQELSPILSNESEEEMEANAFANKVIFDGRAEYLAKKCVENANGRMEKLKFSVEKVAKEENIGTDFLANYLAYRINFEGGNWWGTANSLQVTSPFPFEITRDFLLEKINYNYLNTIEKNMLSMAIN